MIQHQPLPDVVDRVGDIIELARQGPDVLVTERRNEITREGREDLVRNLVALMLQVSQSRDGLVCRLLPDNEVSKQPRGLGGIRRRRAKRDEEVRARSGKNRSVGITLPPLRNDRSAGKGSVPPAG